MRMHPQIACPSFPLCQLLLQMPCLSLLLLLPLPATSTISLHHHILGLAMEKQASEHHQHSSDVIEPTVGWSQHNSSLLKEEKKRQIPVGLHHMFVEHPAPLSLEPQRVH